MKRQPRLTKREKKALAGPRPSNSGASAGQHDHQHIHCTACGRHLDEHEFDAPASAMWASCQHGSQFPTCTACAEATNALLAEHDRTGQPVRAAAAYH